MNVYLNQQIPLDTAYKVTLITTTASFKKKFTAQFNDVKKIKFIEGSKTSKSYGPQTFEEDGIITAVITLAIIKDLEEITDGATKQHLKACYEGTIVCTNEKLYFTQEPAQKSMFWIYAAIIVTGIFVLLIVGRVICLRRKKQKEQLYDRLINE